MNGMPSADATRSALRVSTQSTRQRRIAFTPITVLLAAAMALVVALQIQVDVPDVSSPLQSNHRGVVNAENSVGQTFVAGRNNLGKLSLLLRVEEPSDDSRITFTIRDGGPDGPVLRTLTQPISGLPTEDAFRRDIFNLYYVDQLWHSLDFEPIPDSAGRTLHLSIEGKDVHAPSKVGVAMMFRSGYPEGVAYVNGDAQNAHVVFRAESRGEVWDYLGVLAENATSDRQGLAANPAFYAALALAYPLLLAAALGTAWQALRN